MSIIEERIAQISELESVASNPANDATTRKIASGRIINLWHLIQSQQGSSHAGQRTADKPICPIPLLKD
jgi:hypothetical protein